MSYNVLTIKTFDNQAKRLSKKYPSLKEEISDLIDQLEENPTTGIPLTNNCYKIRFGIRSKGKGKSGSARVITHVWISKKNVYLLTIYDKSDKENISQKELKELLKEIE